VKPELVPVSCDSWNPSRNDRVMRLCSFLLGPGIVVPVFEEFQKLIRDSCDSRNARYQFLGTDGWLFVCGRNSGCCYFEFPDIGAWLCRVPGIPGSSFSSS